MIYVAPFAIDTHGIFHSALNFREVVSLCALISKYRISCKNNTVFICFEIVNSLLSEGISHKACLTSDSASAG